MRSHRAVLAAALVLGSTTATAAAAGPAGPVPAEMPWHELTSENFVLRTDLEPGRASGTLEELELTRALLLAAMFDRPVPLPEPIEVVVFADRDEFVRVTGARHLSGYYFFDQAGRRRIVVSGGIEPIQASVVAHELVHFLSERFIPYQPRWFAEGLAMYFQTVGEGKGLTRSAGTLPGTGHLAALRPGPVKVVDLLAWRGTAGAEEVRYYSTSWLLVHYLMNHERDAFGDYQRRLVRGEAPRSAWNSAFPEYSLERARGTEKLDERLAHHLRSRDWESLPVEAHATITASSRELGPGEVHALKLELGTGRVSSERLRAEASALLAVDPDHLRALAFFAEDEPARAVMLARQAIAAHPEDAEAWEILATASRGPGSLPAQEVALRRACALAPGRSDFRSRLAGTLLEGGRAEEADHEAREGVRLAPFSPAPLVMRALTLLALGRCDEAVEAHGRAMDLAAQTVRPADAGAATEELSRLEQRCHDERLRQADVLVSRAVLAATRNDPGAARPLLEEAVRADPDDRHALMELADVERRLGHLGHSEQLAARYLALEPEGRQTWRFLAALQRLQGRFALAEATLRKELKRSPDDEWARMDLVDLLLDTGRPGEARRLLTAFTGPAKPDSAVAVARARLGLLTGSDPDAAAALKRAVEADPAAFAQATAAAAFAEANVELDAAAELIERARAEFTSLTAAAPLDAIGADHAEASAELLLTWGIAGRIAVRRGQPEAAEALLSSAERAGAGGDVSAYLAEALLAAGRPEDALRAARRALAVSPGQRSALRLAGSSAGAAAGRADLVGLRSLPFGAELALPDRDLFLALGKGGLVLRVVARDSAPLPEALEALRGTSHGVAFPADGPPFLVVPAVAHCTQEDCAVVMGRDLGGASEAP